MKIIIAAEPKEIAALVVAIQERPVLETCIDATVHGPNMTFAEYQALRKEKGTSDV